MSKNNKAFVMKDGFTIEDLSAPSHNADEAVMRFENRSYSFTASLAEEGAKYFENLAASFLTFCYVHPNCLLLKNLNEIREDVILFPSCLVEEDMAYFIDDKDLKIALYKEYC